MQCSWAAAGSCRVCVHGGGLHAARPAAQSVSPAPTTAWLGRPSALHDRWAAGCTLSQPWTTGTPVSRSEQLAATARPLLAGTPTRTPGSSSSWLAGPVTAVRVFWRHGWQADSAPVVCPPPSRWARAWHAQYRDCAAAHAGSRRPAATSAPGQQHHPCRQHAVRCTLLLHTAKKRCSCASLGVRRATRCLPATTTATAGASVARWRSAGAEAMAAALAPCIALTTLLYSTLLYPPLGARRACDTFM